MTALRRWRRPLLLLAAAILGVAAGWWWLPHYRPALRDGERYGIDVSHHQGEIDWERVAGDGIAFAYIKATEGADHVDAQFARNWAAAGDAGVLRGAYHFFTLCRSGAEQAENFLRAVPPDGDALPPAVDLELAGNCAARPALAEVHAELAAFLDAIEDGAGQRAVLYLGPRFDRLYGVSQSWGRPIWRLSLLRRPDMSRVAIWQVMGIASVDGIGGRADLNVADVDALAATAR